MAKNKIFCAQCHEGYDEAAIMGQNGVEGDERPWADVKPGQRPKRSMFGKAHVGLDAVASLAAGYQPYCPAGHLLVEALFSALGEKYATVAVVGNVNSSKSCFIAGLFAELARRDVLGAFGITASTFQSQDAIIDEAIRNIYVAGKVPDATKASAPTTGLVLRLQWRNGERMNLVFYDVAGEVITNMQATADRARYVYSSVAFIMLIDPDGFPSADSFFETVGGNQMATAKEVVGIADGFEQVRGQRPASVTLPLLLTVAKADKIAWTDGMWPPPTGVGAVPAERLGEYFALCEDAVEQQLVAAGLTSVVNAARARFGSNNVIFSRASALGHDVDDNSAGAFRSQGCWQVVLQLLVSLGMATELLSAS